MDKPKTDKQRRAAHKGFELIADELNKRGITQRMLKDAMDWEISWSKDSIKDIFRQIAHAKYGIDSTEELTTIQLQDTWDEMMRMIVDATEGEVYVPFPEDKPGLEIYTNDSLQRS